MRVDGMRKLSMDEVKQRELEILLAFDGLAKEHGIRYSLAYGTLLGAVRHRGFIPWDDDIDIVVPRPDYEQLLGLIRSGELDGGKFEFVGYELGNFPMPFTKMVDPTIHVHDIATKVSIPLSLWIDIFPLDGVPGDDGAWAEECSRAQTCKNLIKVGNYRFLGAGKGLGKRIAKMIAMPFVMLFRMNDKAEKDVIGLAKSEPLYEDAEFVADVVWGPYGTGERFDKSLLDSLASVEFEGHQLPALAGWDAYLTGIYGDYMQLPPAEKRVAHGVEAWIEEDAHE
jgi:lipopolysaccharide cholinephosphotransferase